MTRSRGLALFALMAGALASAASASAGRHLAIILDTSGSMENNDPQRYTVQLSQVLSDLLAEDDELHVIRMVDDSSCSARASSSIALTLDPRDRAGFKKRLDAAIQYDTGTYFAAPIRTAVKLLTGNSGAPRMLLIIADSGGLGSCERVLTEELLQLKGEGVAVAAINLGGTSGAFDRNPAFSFTTPALDAQGLIEAVARVYQLFLGSKKVQTGRVQGAIEVEIAPFVDEAFLVVASDGPLQGIEVSTPNPGAVAINANHRGGGATVGLDSVTRAYRIVRLERPAAGRWMFRVPGLKDAAGWMLLQDSSIGLRLVSSASVPKGVQVPIEVELFDQRSGKRLEDLRSLPGLRVSLTGDGGQQIELRDDGTGNDRRAGDGVLTATTTFDHAGRRELPLRVESTQLDRTFNVSTEVLEARWQLVVRTPPRVPVDRPATLAIEARPLGAATELAPPKSVRAKLDGASVELRDDGRGEDRRAGDRVYSGRWTPLRVGPVRIEYIPAGGSPAVPAAAMVEVVGRLALGKPQPIRWGRLPGRSEVTGRLDLSTADVRGEHQLKATSSFALTRVALEIDTGHGWQPLGRTPITLRLSDSGPRSWPVRLKTGECPEGSPRGTRHEIVLEALGPDGKKLRVAVPLVVEIVPDSWFHCWWPLIAAGLGLLVTAVLAYGFWSPSRFAPRLGVMISQEEDIHEGFLHPIRAVPGTGSGFYRDARAFLQPDFRLSGKGRGALVRLRADAKQVKVQPLGGAAIWRQNAEGAWEQIPADETTAHFGDLYRNDSRTLFFEIRNA